MIKMPEPDRAVLARRSEIVAALKTIVPGEGVIDSERERRAFECDGLTAYRQLPMVVVLPETTAEGCEMPVAEMVSFASAALIETGPSKTPVSVTV